MGNGTTAGSGEEHVRAVGRGGESRLWGEPFTRWGLTIPLSTHYTLRTALCRAVSREGPRLVSNRRDEYIRWMGLTT